jgi:hypothetical protein
MMQQVFAKEIRFVRGKVVIPSIPISTDDNHLPSRQFVPIQEQMNRLGYTIKPAFVRGTVVMPSIPIFTGNNKKNDITK